MRSTRSRIGVCLGIVLGALTWEASAQGVITQGPPVAPTSRPAQRYNPTTRRWERVFVPQASPLYPYPPVSGVTPPAGPGMVYRPSTTVTPYPGYPYVIPNPYPGGQGGYLPPPSAGQTADRQVADWYRRYLRREVDQTGLDVHVRAYYQTGPEATLAGLLGSEEYYRLWGGTPRRFVEGLYADVLQRGATPEERSQWERQVGRKTRTQIALDFLQAARGELGGAYY